MSGEMVRMVKPCLIPKREIQSLNLQSKTYPELNAMNFPLCFGRFPLKFSLALRSLGRKATQKDNSPSPQNIPNSWMAYLMENPNPKWMVWGDPYFRKPSYIPSYSLSQRFLTHIFPQQNGRFPNKTGLTLRKERAARCIHPCVCRGPSSASQVNHPRGLGFPSMDGTPLDGSGWYISWNIPLENGWELGVITPFQVIPKYLM